MSNKNKKRVGSNMKPRGTVSAIAGQGGGGNDAVSEQKETVETSGSLEANSAQNLDSESAATVALSDDMDAVQPIPAVMKRCPDGRMCVGGCAPDLCARTELVDGIPETLPDGWSNVEELRRKSAEKPEPGTYGAIERGEGDHATPGLENLISQNEQLDTPMFGETGLGQNPETGCISNEEHILREIGERPDGTFGLVVTIPEGLIEPIRQQAESDRVTPEEWVSTRLVEYMDSWWQPAASR